MAFSDGDIELHYNLIDDPEDMPKKVIGDLNRTGILLNNHSDLSSNINLYSDSDFSNTSNPITVNLYIDKFNSYLNLDLSGNMDGAHEKYFKNGYSNSISEDKKTYTISAFNNKEFPTRWNYEEQYDPIGDNVHLFKPRRAQLEMTDGRTKNGLDYMIWPNLSKIESPNNEKYAEGIEAYYNIYSNDGTIFSQKDYVYPRIYATYGSGASEHGDYEIIEFGDYTAHIAEITEDPIENCSKAIFEIFKDGEKIETQEAFAGSIVSVDNDDGTYSSFRVDSISNTYVKNAIISTEDPRSTPSISNTPQYLGYQVEIDDDKFLQMRKDEVPVFGKMMRIEYRSDLDENLKELNDKPFPKTYILKHNADYYVFSHGSKVRKLFTENGRLPELDDPRLIDPNDDLCKYTVVMGKLVNYDDQEALNLIKIGLNTKNDDLALQGINRIVDTTNDGFFLIPPTDQMDKKYTLGDNMTFADNSAVSLSQSPRDKIDISIVKAGEVAGIDTDAYKLSLLDGLNQNQELDVYLGKSNIKIASGISDVSEIYFQPTNKVDNLRGRLTFGDHGFTNIANPRFEFLQDGELIYTLEFDNLSDVDIDNIKLKENYPLYQELGQDEDWLAFNQSLDALKETINNYDNLYSFAESSEQRINYSNGTQNYLIEQPKFLDLESNTLFTKKGTTINPILKEDKLIGASFSLFNNEEYPTRWTLNEEHIPFIDGPNLDLPAIAFVSVAPNPISRQGTMQIETRLLTPGKVSYSLFDLQGKPIADFGVEEFSFISGKDIAFTKSVDLTPFNLALGNYLLVMSFENTPDSFDSNTLDASLRSTVRSVNIIISE
jgi:hypothetical protein